MPTSKSNLGKKVETRGPISCITRVSDSRGRSVAVRWFDAPAESYTEGNVTGCRIAAEFFQALPGYGPLSVAAPFDAVQIIAGACQALNDGTGRRGAAVGFLRTIEETLRLAADHWDLAELAERKAERVVLANREITPDPAREKAEFVARMQAAKAAKAAKAAREASHG